MNVYDPATQIVRLRAGAEGELMSGRIKVWGIPVHMDWDCPVGVIYYQGQADGSAIFKCRPGDYPADHFIRLVRKYQEVAPMTDQLLEGIDLHDTSLDDLGPSDGTPLQEIVERLEEESGEWKSAYWELRDQERATRSALNTALELVEGLKAERKDYADQTYQAQLDAQAWQNQYNEMKRGRDQDNGLVASRPADSELIREQQDTIIALLARTAELTDQNTELELRNERLVKRGYKISDIISGFEDD